MCAAVGERRALSQCPHARHGSRRVLQSLGHEMLGSVQISFGPNAAALGDTSCRRTFAASPWGWGALRMRARGTNACARLYPPVGSRQSASVRRLPSIGSRRSASAGSAAASRLPPSAPAVVSRRSAPKKPPTVQAFKSHPCPTLSAISPDQRRAGSAGRGLGAPPVPAVYGQRLQQRRARHLDEGARARV